jgi:hypothetical protein
MSIDVHIVAAEAPIALVVAEWGIYPLTPCCQASTKGCTATGEGGVVCRACYKEIHPLFGACWLPDDEQGWGWYKQLLVIADGDNNADEIVAYARDKANAVTHVIHPKIPTQSCS